MTNEPILIDEMTETDVYVATLEMRSVGSSKNMYPNLRFSHHFTQQPEDIPTCYKAVLQIVEKIGAVLVEKDAVATESTDDLDAAARAMEAAASQTEGTDDTIH